MDTLEDTRPDIELIIARELSRLVDDDPAARRAAARGELVRIRRGIYARAEEWAALSPRDKYRAVVRGYSLSRRTQPVLSHASAAVLWGLPHIGRQPSEVYVIESDRQQPRGRVGVRTHLVHLEPDDVVTVDGIVTTSLLRTVVDIAARADVMTAVSVIDHVLYVDRFGKARTGITKDDLREALERARPMWGSVRARARTEFGETGAETPAESISRVTMAHVGAPAPQLQRCFETELGIFSSDFYFEEADAIGETDGKVKYLDPRFRGGRSSEQVVYDEKLREDALRRQVRAFVRWPMATGMNRDRMRDLLSRAGIPLGRPRPPLA